MWTVVLSNRSSGKVRRRHFATESEAREWAYSHDVAKYRVEIVHPPATMTVLSVRDGVDKGLVT